MLSINMYTFNLRSQVPLANNSFSINFPWNEMVKWSTWSHTHLNIISRLLIHLNENTQLSLYIFVRVAPDKIHHTNYHCFDFAWVANEFQCDCSKLLKNLLFQPCWHVSYVIHTTCSIFISISLSLPLVLHLRSISLLAVYFLIFFSRI